MHGRKNIKLYKTSFPLNLKHNVNHTYHLHEHFKNCISYNLQNKLWLFPYVALRELTLY